VFQRLGPKTRRDDHIERPSRDDLELEEEDKYHHPRWCLEGLSRSQKRRVQRLRNLEEAEARYLDVLRKARPDLAEKVRHTRSWKGVLQGGSGAPSRQEPMKSHRLM
jgi:hypothetical protein